jgi:uncharacterized protein (DUF1800 family)
MPQLTGDQKILHALNRLTFGPRPGDVEAMRQLGLDRWIEQQLHPGGIPENPILEAKLAPLDTLRMTTAEMVRHYPTPQMVKQIVDRKLPMPADPETRILVRKLAARVQRGEGPEPGPLSAKQNQVLDSDDPAGQIALLESMPESDQYDVLDSMRNGQRQKLYTVAPPELRRKIRIFRGPVQVVNQDLSQAKLLRAIYSDRQLEEVLTDFWYNHFNVFLDKGADRYMVTSYERDVIRPHVLGKFEELLLATAQSPAMLFYLDNWLSVGPDIRQPRQRAGKGLNENYGRELMELHTLGVDGGYTQKDVTEVARCFTGWTIREPRFGGGYEYNDRRHDKDEKHVLGVKIPAGGGESDGLKVIDILAHSPATARFISKNLAIRFVSDNPPDALVNWMAKRYMETGGDLREVMRAMLDSPEFWNPENFRSKVKSPLEMVSSAVRAVNGDIDYADALVGTMNQLGEPLYRKLEPTGYSNRGTDWLNSASLLARMNFALTLAQGKVSGIKVDPAQFAGEPASIERMLLFADPSPQTLAAIDPSVAGAKVAGLTLGSPDFQRR